MIRFVTGGESHGKQLVAIIEGIPAGLKLKAEDIDTDLARRQHGFGRGARMKLEYDRVEFLSGVRWGETLGSPITLSVKNSDWENNKSLMSELEEDFDAKSVQVYPRPGHADLPGVLKYDRSDIRDILERASARETAIRVAAGAVCKKLLQEFGIKVYSFVKEIGGVEANVEKAFEYGADELIDKSALRTIDLMAEEKMKEVITKAKEAGDTVGGVFTVVAKNVPVGLGSHTQWDLKLDGKIARSMMSIQAVKGVSFGIGDGFSKAAGSLAHDEILYLKGTGFYRNTNNAGGIEGGMTNGEQVVVNCVMKPIPSLTRPLKSVNLETKQPDAAQAVRSDVCAVPAAGVVGEAALAFELAAAMKEKFGGDSIREMKRNYDGYIEQVKRR